MVDIQALPTISIVIASAGVFVAAIYYVFQIRHQTRIRQTDLVIRLYSTFNNEEFTKMGIIVGLLEYRDYDDFVGKYGSLSPEEPVWVAIHMVSNFMNEVGILLHGKHVSIEQVDELLGYRIAYTWEKMKPLIDGMRKQFNPRVGEWFEYLYDEMKKKEQESVKHG